MSSTYSESTQPTLTAVVDSNEVVAGSGDGLAFKEASYYGRYGTLTAVVRANTVMGKSGAGILASANYPSGWVTVSVTAEDNQITGCGYGVKAQGENLVLQRNVITGSSQWGVHCQDATATMRDKAPSLYLRKEFTSEQLKDRQREQQKPKGSRNHPSASV